MLKYIFYGAVLPERVNINASPHEFVSMDGSIKIVAEILRSKIIIESSVNNHNINIPMLKNEAERIARCIVDSLGFAVACGYDVEIESVYDIENKKSELFGVHENIFDDVEINKSTNKGAPHPGVVSIIQDIPKLSAGNINLQVALSDFREAIRQPTFTSFYCYRAVESLMQFISGDKSNAGWKKFRNLLQVEESDIRDIQNHADQIRHGIVVEQAWEDRKRHMYVTWDIIRKYIEWLHSEQKLANTRID